MTVPRRSTRLRSSSETLHLLMEPPKSVGCGCLLSVASGLMLLFIFGMSTLSGGQFQEGGAEWWSAVLGTMLRSPDPGTTTYACIAALGFGLYLCLRPSLVRWTIRRMMAWVAVVAVVLGVLSWCGRRQRNKL